MLLWAHPTSRSAFAVPSAWIALTPISPWLTLSPPFGLYSNVCLQCFIKLPIQQYAHLIKFFLSSCHYLLLLLSRFSRVRLCATPYTAAHQAPPSLGFSRQEHWSGLPFPSPMHESEKWKWSHSVVSNSLRPHGPQPTRLCCPWDFPDESTGVGCHCLLHVTI